MIRSAGLAAAVLAASPAAAAVTVGAQIVDTRLSGTIASMPVDSAGSDALTRTGTINASAQLVERGQGAPLLRASSTVIAELPVAERGRVTFRRTLTPGSVAGGNDVTSSAATYRYVFTTDTPIAFDVNWGVATFGTAAEWNMPSQMLSLAAQGSGDTLLRLHDLGNGASGLRQLTLDPGSYELRIQDAFSPVAGAGNSSGLSSQYSFAMRAVPEPASWTMLLIGFALTGAVMRRGAHRSPARRQMKLRSRG